MPEAQALFRVLKQLEVNPEMSQRELAGALGISLGSVNLCLKVLIEKGCIKMHHFPNSQNKQGYAYRLTAEGVRERGRMTADFLERKMQEYVLLRAEIEALRQDVETDAASRTGAGGSGL